MLELVLNKVPLRFKMRYCQSCGKISHTGYEQFSQCVHPRSQVCSCAGNVGNHHPNVQHQGDSPKTQDPGDRLNDVHSIYS